MSNLQFESKKKITKIDKFIDLIMPPHVVDKKLITIQRNYTHKFDSTSTSIKIKFLCKYMCL